MKHIQLKDSRIIVLKPMDNSFIIQGGEGRCPANCDMRAGGNMTPTKNFEILSKRMIKRYGTTAILAMDKDLVIGFVDFCPQWCPRFYMCDDELIDKGMKHLDEIENPPFNSDSVLYVNCLMIKEQYRGNELSVQLLEYLKEWAKENGWSKIVANGCIFSGKAKYQWLVSPKPPKPIWEKAGFTPGNYSVFKTESSHESTQANREWYRTYELTGSFPRDVNPDDNDWYEIFKDYTMICQL
ncbi:N-acetyltransferase [Marinilabiliaceae bacterium JC017]|nr:N-acetyltransferase [Marinilabiliaceae bacterium JC017]